MLLLMFVWLLMFVVILGYPWNRVLGWVKNGSGHRQWRHLWRDASLVDTGPSHPSNGTLGDVQWFFRIPTCPNKFPCVKLWGALFSWAIYIFEMFGCDQISCGEIDQLTCHCQTVGTINDIPEVVTNLPFSQLICVCLAVLGLDQSHAFQFSR